MKRNRHLYSTGQLASTVFMMLALLWLTISIPFVYDCQQKLSKNTNFSEGYTILPGTEEETTNPFGNSTEEKAQGNTSFSEEYLHHHLTHDYVLSIASQIHASQNCGTYNAFHGEVHVPPPNLA